MVYWSTLPAPAPARLREWSPEYGDATDEPVPDASVPDPDAPAPKPDAPIPDAEALAPDPNPWEDVEALEDLADRIATLEAHITAAKYEGLVMVAEFDRRRGWELGGHRDCAAWLSYRLNMHRRTAQEKVRVARALEELPRIGDAMKRGELSYSTVRALTRVADPESEEELLELGRCLPVGQLEKTLRGWGKGSRESEEQRAKELHRLRRLAVFADDGGSYEVRGRLTPEEGLRVQRALDWAMDKLFREKEAREGTTYKQRVADALVFLIDRAVEAGVVGELPDRQEPEAGAGVASAEEGPGGPPRSAERGRGANSTEARPGRAGQTESAEDEREGPEDAAGPRSAERERGKDVTPAETDNGRRAVSATMAERYLVFLHLDLDTLDPDSEPGRAELDDGNRISPEAARRLTCDASVVNVIRGEHGEVLDVGRKYRTPHPALRRALWLRDRGCRFPGCDLRWTTPHHVEHWAVGGETSTKNCVLLCNHHHWLVHEGGWKVHLNNRDATAVFVDLEGGFHMSRRPGPAVGDGVDADEEGEGWPEEVRRWLAARGKRKTVNGRAVLARLGGARPVPPRDGGRSRHSGSVVGEDGGRPSGSGETAGQPNGRPLASPDAPKGDGGRSSAREGPPTDGSDRAPAGSADALVHENERRGVNPDGWSLSARCRRSADVPLEVETEALEAWSRSELG